MSCETRRYRYRTGVSSCANTSWCTGSHPPTIHAPTIPPATSSISGSYRHMMSLSPITWDIIRALLHTQTDDGVWQACESIIRLIESHGWHRLPALPDEDIVQVWKTALAMLPPGLLPVLHRQELPLSVLRDVVFFLFTHASVPVRNQLWQEFRNVCRRYVATESVGVQAMQWGIPLWMVPEGLAMVRESAQTGSSLVLTAIRDAICRWLPDDTHNVNDPSTISIREGIHQILLTIGGIPDPASHHPEDLHAWLTFVHRVLWVNPIWSHALSERMATIVSACMSDSTDVAHAALDVIAALNRFDHPTLHGAMESVIRTSRHAAVCQRAALLMMEAIGRSPEPQTIRRVIAMAWELISNPNQATAQMEGAITIIRSAMQWDDAVPLITSYLQDRVSHLPRFVVYALFRSPYPESCTAMMIDLSTSLLCPRYHDIAIDVLSHAWGKGHDGDVATALFTHAARCRHPLPLDAMHPALYAPHIGSQYIAMLTMKEPHTVAQTVLGGIAAAYRPDSPIPSDVLPTVVRACWDAPDAVTVPVLDAIWNTDPAIAIDVTRMLISRAHSQELAIRSLGTRWGKGYDAAIAALIHHVMDGEKWHRREIVQAITDVILAGAETGVPDILVVWQQLVSHIPLNRVVDVCQQTTGYDRWNRIPPSISMTLLHTLYTRIGDTGTGTRTTGRIRRAILRSLVYGWGDTTDSATMCTLLSFILTDIVHRGTTDPSVVDEMGEVVRVLRFGWGRGHDRSIGTMLCTIMEWLDRVHQRWRYTAIGSAVMTAITAGGGDPFRTTLYDEGGIDPDTLLTVRMALDRRVAWGQEDTPSEPSIADDR